MPAYTLFKLKGLNSGFNPTKNEEPPLFLKLPSNSKTSLINKLQPNICADDSSKTMRPKNWDSDTELARCPKQDLTFSQRNALSPRWLLLPLPMVNLHHHSRKMRILCTQIDDIQLSDIHQNLRWSWHNPLQHQRSNHFLHQT